MSISILHDNLLFAKESVLSFLYYDPLLSLVVVGFFWGATNPYLKKGLPGVELIEERNRFKKIFKEILFFVTNLKYVIPFLVNQCGSVIYYLLLKKADLTIAVPVSNSSAFVFTALTGWWLGEETPDFMTMFGMTLVAIGISCYALSS